jgi:hypothetical protein
MFVGGFQHLQVPAPKQIRSSQCTTPERKAIQITAVTP